MVPWSGKGAPKERENVTKDMNRLLQTAYAEGKPGWLGCGYGPFRRLSGGTSDIERILGAERKSARFVTLFHEQAALTNATGWLVRLHNTGREGDQDSLRALAQVKNAFATELFPEPTKLHVNASEALLQIGNRQLIPLRDLSDGYRSMLALSIDLLRWLTKAFPDAKNPMHCPGVVLIDELDAHMHPEWQRQIGHWLLGKFPKIQFIVATHSPFLAQVADADKPDTIASDSDDGRLGGNISLEETGEGVKARPDFEPAQDLRADQLLLSSLFGLESLHSPKTEWKLRRHQELHRKQEADSLSEEERQEYEQLDLWREGLPVLSDPTERHMEQVLQKAIQRHPRRDNDSLDWS